MLIVAHRINTLDGLDAVPDGLGVEIDVRGCGDQMLLSHDPISSPENIADLESYLRKASLKKVPLIVFNMKEAGYEKRVIDMAAKCGISRDRYFLLDVEFPYLYRASRSEGIREIAVRYSEAEPIEFAEAQIVGGKPLVDWVWIDTNTKLPIDASIARRLSLFKTCLVSPDRWGRPEDIGPYIKEIRKANLKLDAVMTGIEHIDAWRHAFVV